MRLTATLAGLFLCVFVFSMNTTKVNAQAQDQPLFDSSASITYELAVIDQVEQQSEKNLRLAQEAQAALLAAQIQEYVVAEGDTLSTIAKQYETTWERLFAKNANMPDPDLIKVGDKLVIPKPDEQLADRNIPEPVAVQSPAPSNSNIKAKTTNVVSRGGSSGNTYAQGYCTWYAKNKRPDLPNNLGNADTWVSRARAQGIPTGSAPQVGAIGQRGMHVVYIERVNGDGTVFVSEMNYVGLGVVSTRTAPASDFQYIY